jgi:hypothetical protein
VCFVVIFTFFIYQGWIEIGIFGKVYRNIHHTQSQQIDDSSKVDAQNSRAAQRANQEEVRRKEESNLMRQSATLAARKSFSLSNSQHGFGSAHGFGSMHGKYPPSASPASSNHSQSILHLNKKSKGINDNIINPIVDGSSLHSIPEDNEDN